MNNHIVIFSKEHLDITKEINHFNLEDRINEVDELFNLLEEKNFKWYYDDSIMYQEILPKLQLHEYLYSYKKNNLDRDYSAFLRSIFKKMKISSPPEIQSFENNVGNKNLKVFFQFNGQKTKKLFFKDLNEFQEAKYENLEVWNNFDMYIDICKIIFENLIFKNNIKIDIKTLKNSLKDNHREISLHLKHLNKDVYTSYTTVQNKDLSTIISDFESRVNFNATLEGNAKKVKKYFTFNIDGTDYKCEPHTKLRKSNGDYSNDRIHFSLKKIFDGETKVMIGYIGKHL